MSKRVLVLHDGEVKSGRDRYQLEEVYDETGDEWWTARTPEWRGGADDVVGFAWACMFPGGRSGDPTNTQEKEWRWLIANEASDSFTKPYVLCSPTPKPLQRQMSQLTQQEELQYVNEEYPGMWDDLSQLARFWPFV